MVYDQIIIGEIPQPMLEKIITRYTRNNKFSKGRQYITPVT